MPVCNMCGESFDVETAPGALLFGHPSTVKEAVPVMKAHICQPCERVIVEAFVVPPTNPNTLPHLGESRIGMGGGTEVGIRETRYAMGTERDGDSIGFFYGPTPILKEMKDLAGSSDRDVIVRFNSDGTDDIIFRWRQGLYENFEWMPEGCSPGSEPEEVKTP